MQTYTVTAQIKVSVMSGTAREQVLTELKEQISKLRQGPYAPAWSISDASDVKVSYENVVAEPVTTKEA